MLISFCLVCLKSAENMAISSVCEISDILVQQLGMRSLEFPREESRELFITPSLVITAPVMYLYCAQSCQRK